MMMKYFTVILIVLMLISTPVVWAGTVTVNPVYSGISGRPLRDAESQPRVVWNAMNKQYGRYWRSSGVNWADFPASTGQITWGDDAPTIQVNSVVTTFEQVFAAFSFTAVSGVTYILSFYVNAISGVHTNNNTAVYGITTSGSTRINNPSTGRHVLKFVATSSGVATVRLGIGVDGANPNTASITFSKVMLEIPSNTARTYPYEYVYPQDARAFPYTFTASPTGDVVGVETLGTPFAARKSASVLVIGDSFTDDKGGYSNFSTDFPFYISDYFQWIYPTAITSRGVSGQTISQITTQLTAAMTEAPTHITSGVLPWTTVLIEGGVNDVNAGRTLAQMQADRLAQIATAQSYGLQVVMMDVCPFNSASGAQQTIIDGFNAWLPTLGLPTYKCFADMTNGANQWRTDAVSPDGIHPGTGYRAGAYQIALRLQQLLRYLP